MANSIVRLPTGYFPDPDTSRPLFFAKIYIGEPDLDPKIPANQKTVTGRREDGVEVTLAQPVRTNRGGVPVDGADGTGNVVTLLVDGAYSMTVDDRKDAQKYNFANVLDGAPVLFSDKPVLYRPTLSVALADLTLTEGLLVITGGYTTENDGGGGQYVVVAGSTGTPDGLTYLDKTDGSGLQLELIINGEINIKQTGALNDGSVDISAQLTTALSVGEKVFFPIGDYLLENPVTVPSGRKILGESGTATTYLNNTGSELWDGGVRFLIDHGAGITDTGNRAAYYANAAFTMNQGSEIRDVSFWYPSQTMNSAGPPTAYPPAIATAYLSRSATIDTVSLGNSYIGIDARREQSNTTINNLWGYPLSIGIRIGSNVDPSYVSNIYFSPVRGYYNPEGEAWISPNLSSWVAQNGTMIEIGRLTWSQFTSIWSIAYGVGIDMINQAADAANGINTGGSAQNCNFIGCGFDSNEIGIRGNGFQGRLGILNCNFAPKNFNNNPSTTTYGILLENTLGSVTDVNISDCHFWSIAQNGIKITGHRESKVVNCSFEDLAQDAVGTAIELDNSLNSEVSGNTIDGSSATAGSTGITLVNSCEDSVVTNNKIRSLDGSPIVINATDTTYVAGNTFDSNTSAGIQDTSATKKYSNIIKDNIDPDYLFTDYGNSDVDVNGLLTVNIGAPVIRYTGTTTINGLTHGRQGETVVMRFSAAATITDADGATAQENRLNLAGNFTTALGSTLTLTSFGSLGWFEVSRSTN